MHKLSLFIFRRDLRVQDNTALLAALRESENVIPCFIFDDRQIKKNDYFSKPAFDFMCGSLCDLDNQLKKCNGKLYLFKGVAEEVVEKLLLNLPIDAVYFNRDYTVFSKTRDEKIKKISEKNNRKCFIYADALLHEPEEVFKKDHTPYTIYTPFMRQARTLPVAKPIACKQSNFYHTKIEGEIKNEHAVLEPAGRSIGFQLLKDIAHIKDYEKNRDFPALNCTSHLSPHHKFGTVSIRETYQHIAKAHGTASVLINELFWRDFFTHIAFHFPRVFSGAFHEKYNQIKWENNEKKFQKWCQGETGFPIVDAGMRELNETGLMHNRVRMITASFLIKDLHIDWHWGEKYFAQKLIDYDPCVNNGNWQWAASTGCDAQPYFRIFNPILQQKRFDPDFVYIKKWIPGFRENYLNPIVDHAVAAKIAQQKYAICS